MHFTYQCINACKRVYSSIQHKSQCIEITEEYLCNYRREQSLVVFGRYCQVLGELDQIGSSLVVPDRDKFSVLVAPETPERLVTDLSTKQYLLPNT